MTPARCSCGGMAKLKTERGPATGAREGWVECVACGAQGEAVKSMADNAREAIELWNAGKRRQRVPA